jgi:hypothetical protein
MLLVHSNVILYEQNFVIFLWGLTHTPAPTPSQFTVLLKLMFHTPPFMRSSGLVHSIVSGMVSSSAIVMVVDPSSSKLKSL